MRPSRRSTHGRRTMAVSVLTAGAVALSGSAAMAVGAQAAPATTRDALPADPLTAPAALLALVAQVTEAVNPILNGLLTADLQRVIAGLTDSQLGALLTQVTGTQLSTVLDGSALNRALAAVATLTSSQIVALLETAADAARTTVPQPVGYALETLLDVAAGVLSDRGVPIPSQITDVLDRPAVAAPAPPVATVVPRMRARIFDATAARDRRSVRVELTCPAASDARCAVVVRTSVAGTRAAAVRRTTIERGRTKVLRPTLTRQARERLRTRGGTIRVTAATTGASRGPVAATVRVPRPR